MQNVAFCNVVRYTGHYEVVIVFDLIRGSQMKKHRFVALLASALLCACATQIPKQAFDKKTGESLKSVALVEFPDPNIYSVLGLTQSAYTAPLLLFGAIGGAIMGTANISIAQEQAKRLSEAMKPHQPNASSNLLAELEAQLKARGFEVTRIKAPEKKTEDDKELSYAEAGVTQDAILESKISLAGYRWRDGRLAPLVGVRVRLLAKTGQPALYADLIQYGDKMNDQFVDIPADPKYEFSDLDKLYAGGNLAAEGIRAGTKQIANRIAADLR